MWKEQSLVFSFLLSGQPEWCDGWVGNEESVSDLKRKSQALVEQRNTTGYYMSGSMQEALWPID